jgi:hypothetical protein
MDEHLPQRQQVERPPLAAEAALVPGAVLADPRALTILSTEHWSLLTARSLVYNETFARGGMFLAFLSATLVALGLVSTGSGFSSSFLAVAAAVLAVDLFVGVATYGRIAAANRESVRYLQGMNRLRHAYHEMVPGLEPYFVTGRHDDLRGVFGAGFTAFASPVSVLHHYTTMPGMVAVMCASVAAALGADAVLLLTGSALVADLVAAVILLAGIAGSAMLATRAARLLAASLESVFPTPD